MRGGEKQMKKMMNQALKASAKISKMVAVKSCGMTSLIDTYQPKMPEAVRKLKEQKNG